ncbi:MAG: hypothetical protein LBR06_07550, partial [Bacteroidales bacterium]|nr:hypothetical protein [Bacteroidales bacterium]
MRKILKISAMLLCGAAIALFVLAGSNAVAFKSSADIAPGSRQRIATKGDWRDFGTERKFTRVLLNSPTAQNVSLEKF